MFWRNDRHLYRGKHLRREEEIYEGADDVDPPVAFNTCAVKQNARDREAERCDAFPVRLKTPTSERFCRMRYIRVLRLIFLMSALLIAFGAEAGSILWKAERDGKQVWLLGSIHAATTDMYPLPESMEAAYRQADTVWVEAADVYDGDRAALAAKLQAMALLPPGQTLSQMLNAKQRKLLDAAFAEGGLLAKDANMSREKAETLRPIYLFMWLAANPIAAEEGVDGQYGIDQHFADEAKADGKHLDGLETAESQMQALLSISQADAVSLMCQALAPAASPKAPKQGSDDMAQAWKSGNIPALRRIFAPADPLMARFYSIMLDARNRLMAEKIAASAGTPAPLVVVGAAHLIGPNNLLGMLRARGFKVTQY